MTHHKRRLIVFCLIKKAHSTMPAKNTLSIIQSVDFSDWLSKLFLCQNNTASFLRSCRQLLNLEYSKCTPIGLRPICGLWKREQLAAHNRLLMFFFRWQIIGKTCSCPKICRFQHETQIFCLGPEIAWQVKCHRRLRSPSPVSYLCGARWFVFQLFLCGNRLKFTAPNLAIPFVRTNYARK